MKTPADPDPVALAGPLGEGGSADLVVVGAGVLGTWTALLARRAGRTTALVDAYGAGHPRATSGDETRIMRSSHAGDAFYARWSRQARDRWLDFAEERHIRLFVQAGALWFARRADGFEAASIATLGDLGIPVERLTADEVRARWPQVTIDDGEWAAFEPEAGLLLARRGVMAVAGAFAELGGRFAIAAVRPGRREGRRLIEVVTADGGQQVGDQFVFACGPWLPRLFPEHLGARIRVTKQDVMYLGPAGGDVRFSASRFPCWVDYDVAFYGIPGVDERGFKIAPDRYGPVFDPSSGERSVDPESVRLTRAYAARRFPSLATAPIVETRVCQYETTADTHFIVDRHPDYDNVWLVGGGSGHAFKHGPVLGAYVVGLLDGESPGSDEARFALDRPRSTEVGLRTGADEMVGDWQGY